MYLSKLTVFVPNDYLMLLPSTCTNIHESEG